MRIWWCYNGKVNRHNKNYTFNDAVELNFKIRGFRKSVEIFCAAL